MHALGLNRDRWSYRNRYVGFDAVCEGLVERGLMYKRETLGQPVYHVTDAGIEAACLGRRVRKADRMK